MHLRSHFLLYCFFAVDSNDTLYGSDPKFITEINKMCSVLLEEILAHLKYLNTSEQFQKQVRNYVISSLGSSEKYFARGCIYYTQL